MGNAALGMIGMALRAGRLAVGDEACGDACRYKRCRLLLLTADAGEGARRRAGSFAEAGQCLLAQLPCSKEELGAALGRGSCAMAAVTDLGLAQAIVQKLAREEPEKYGEMAQRLRLKAQRAAQRREKAAKNRQQRGKRPLMNYKKK